MPRSLQDLIAEIRDSASIVDVISYYIPVKRAGRSYKALCPFHPDRNPSLMISEEKGLWHCFGCGAGGDVFSFVMKMENVDFMEAAKLVAERVGIPFKWEGRGRWDNILEICETCAKYFHNVLLSKPEGEKALHYLQGRGMNMETIKQFMLGFAPPDLKELLNLLKDYPNEDLENCGIFSKREGRLHLILSGRITFPIFSPNGKVIAFGGRVLDDSTPKYINSWETALFRKGRILYGFHLAKKDIMEAKKAFIVEGYMDLIALYSAGIKNTVATLGTALTDEHLRLLKRYCEEIYLAFDPDSPGMNATLRASPLIEEAGLRAKVILIPEGYDPDTFIRKKGKKGFEEIVEKAVDISDFQLKKALEKGDEGRQEAIDIISNISDPGKRNEVSKKLAEELAKGDPEMVREYLNWITLEVRKRRAGDRTKVRVTATPSMRPEEALGKMEKVEKEFVRSLLLEPSFIKPVTEIIKEELLSNSLLRSIYSKIKSLAGEGFSRGALLDMLEEEEKKKVSEIELEELPPPTEQVVYDCALKILEIYLKRVGQINREALKLINEGKLARKKSIVSLRSLFKTLQNLL
ncbi:DNA primase [bacterium]|nr:DNA primase [bacterium]